jgi:hypothetical protein
MAAFPTSTIPARAETLQVLRAIAADEFMLMFPGAADGYGARWTVDGQQVQPAIAGYLMKAGLVVDAGPTGLGARRLALTEAGAECCCDGMAWWQGLSHWQRLLVRLFG